MKKLIEYDGNVYIPGINVQERILAKDKYNEYLYLVIKSAKLIRYPKFYKIP